MVKIEIRKADKVQGTKSLFLSFPYDKKLVNIMRTFMIRWWHPGTKEWELRYEYLDQLKTLLKDYEIDMVDSYYNQNLPDLNKKEYNYIPKNYKFKIKPFKHQLEGIQYGLENDRFLLGDEQGLGKTMQAISIACIKKKERKYKHCLIICGVNGLKWNWKAEVEKHSNETAYILGTRYRNNSKEYIGTVTDRLEDLKHPSKIKSYFIITNIETLRNEEIISVLKLLCDTKVINMIVVDEFHKAKSVTSIQTKHLLKLQAETMIAMTGTPLMNNPLDLYAPMKWLGYEKHSYYAFKNHYCIMGGFGGYQVTGYRHLDQLKEQFEGVMLRRLKQEVLDLPDKIYTTDFVEMNAKQLKIYNEVRNELLENIDLVSTSINPLSQMIRLRQATGYTGILSSTIQESAKLERLEELLEEIVPSGKKAIIFSNWVSMTNPIYERFKKYNPAIITGETKDRVAEEKKFMQDSSCKIIIGTTGAMGTGLTLTAASYVIFVDEPWNRALREQAEDRAHRIGTNENINIIFLITKNSIDERIHNLVEEKGALADLLVDGKLNDNDKLSLVQYLLS